MKKNVSHDVLAFDFQPIELNELRKILPRSKYGKYDDIKFQILERVKSMPMNESFLLAPAKESGKKGLLDEQQIKSFTNSINGAFRDEKLPWHVVYSTIAKAFAIAPYKRKGRIPRVDSYELPKSRQQSFPLEDGKLGFVGDKEDRLNKLLTLATHTFGFSLKQLQEKGVRGAVSRARMAMCYVGKNGLGLKLSTIGALLEMSSGSTTPLCQQAPVRAKEEIAQLSQALNKS